MSKRRIDIIASSTLFRYVAKRYFAVFIGTISIIGGIIFLADWVEVARQISDDGAGAVDSIQLTLLRLPTLLMKILPYASLIAGAFTFKKLADTSELTAMRASGFSAMQFLAPALCTSLCIGMFIIAFFQPLAAVTYAANEHKEKVITEGEDYQANIVETGLWLRQQDANQSGTTFIRARRLGQEEGSLRDVMFFTVDDRYLFLRRIDTPKTTLDSDGWRITHPDITTPNGPMTTTPNMMTLASNISPRSIKESSAPPESVPFWDMREFMRILHDSGFPTTAHFLEFLRLAVMPLSLAAMTMFGAAFTLSHARFSRGGMSIALALSAGLVFFALEQLAQALGLSGKLPMLFAVIITPALATLTAMWLLLHRDEG